VIVLDASVMIAILDSSDAHFTSAKRLFIGHAAERLAAHRLTVGEILVQAARAGRERAVAAALATLGVGYLDAPDDPVELARLRASTGLRMPDCCVLLAVMRDRAGLATFDSRLAGAARSLGVVVASGSFT
jgi:predicted nucleic acid-binding protein